MHIKLDHDITIEQRQELVMTPELIQSVKILKYNLAELDVYVKDQIKDNPVLEQENPSWERQLKNSSNEKFMADNYKFRNTGDDYYPFENYVIEKESLADHLMMQLEISTKSKDILRIGEYLIESLNENGYLTVELKTVAEALDVDVELVKKALRLIHNFEPYGVGARNLAECLMIQLRQVGLLDDSYLEFLKHHIDDLAANRLKKIAKSMAMPVEEIQQRADVIRHLDPKPGKQYSKSERQYIVPEIIVEENGGEYVAVFQDDSVPKLMVSSYYQSVLAEHSEDPEVIKYIKSRIDAANNLINAIEKRKQTIRKVAGAIVEYQQDFFKKGEKNIKPLTLKMIAEKIDMHESTVSRATTGKYLQCLNGVFELKYFFSSGLKSTGPEKELSSSSIKAYIREIISKENPRQPASDQKITDMLNGSGISIARRTVAKYRESMNIPASTMRKRY